MLNVFSKGRRKSHDCNRGSIEKPYSLGLQKYIPIWPTQWSTPGPTPRVSAQPRAVEFLWQKFSAFFSATISSNWGKRSKPCSIFLLGNFQAPHKQRFGFCDSSLFPYTTMTFMTTLLGNLARAPKR